MFRTLKMLAMRVAAASVAAPILVIAAGCSDRPQHVPASAQMTVEGKDHVAWTADRGGTVWVSDEGNQKVLYSTHVISGDRIALDANRNQLTLNDRVVLDTGVHHVEHKIFFEPSEPTMTARAVVAPDVVVVTPRPVEVPATATMRAHSTGELIELRPDSDGTAWVVSEPDRRVVYSGRVLHGDTLAVDPRGNRLTLNGRSVYDQSLPRGPYEVYFMSGAR
jgi:hypothetical protein